MNVWHHGERAITKINHLLVPIAVDALLLTKAETVLAPSADFSRLPYRDRTTQRAVNASISYSGEGIVAPPLRGKTFDLQPGARLHWAMPDALTQGVTHRDAEGAGMLEFPVLPDRWRVTRRNKFTRAMENQWLVVSDYLYPEQDLEAAAPKGAINFPVPPLPDAAHGQPFRFMGRRWKLGTTVPDWPGTGQVAEFFNALASKYVGQDALQRVVADGLTALGYGDPSFAAFYPNCHSVFGLHDPDITTAEQFGKVIYEVTGWYDDAKARDVLNRGNDARKTVLQKIKKADQERRENELRTSGHEVVAPDDRSSWASALSQVYGWAVDLQDEEIPERTICFGSVSATESADYNRDPAQERDDVTIAIGNTANEALSAAMAKRISGPKKIIEEQLEALDLSHKLQHRQLDIGSKFQEARHERGFKSEHSGTLFTLRLETPEKADHHAVPEQKTPLEICLPSFLAEALNALNTAQQRYDTGRAEIRDLQGRIYRDWTLYMQSLRPDAAFMEDMPGPFEMIRFIEKTGLLPLRKAQSATGPAPVITRATKEAPNGTEQHSGHITNVSLPSMADPASLSAQLARNMQQVLEGLTNTNTILRWIQRLNQMIALEQARERKPVPPTPEYPVIKQTLKGVVSFVREISFSPDGKKLLLHGKDDGLSNRNAVLYELDATNGRQDPSVTLLDDPLAALFGAESSSIFTPYRSLLWEIDASTGEDIRECHRHNNFMQITNVIHNKATNRVISCGYDGAIRQWDCETNRAGRVIELVSTRLKTMAVNSAGTHVAVGSDTTSVSIFDLITGDVVGTVLSGDTEPKALAFSPDGSQLLTINQQGFGGLTDIATGKMLLDLSMDGSTYDHVVFSEDQKYLGTSTRTQRIKIWSLETFQQIGENRYVDGVISNIAMSPDGTMLATASYDGDTKVWDCATSEMLFDLDGLAPNATAVCFDPTGSKIALAQSENDVVIVEVADATQRPQTLHERYGIDVKTVEKAAALRDGLLFDLTIFENLDELADFASNFPEFSEDHPDSTDGHQDIATSQFVLRQIEAPRFHQPTDPVVLMLGEGIAPTERHGMDGRHREDGHLECQILSLEQIPALKDWENGYIPAAFEDLDRFLDAQDRKENGPAHRLWEHQPWHPFAMEWEVNVTPNNASGNRETSRARYKPDFVSRHNTLRETDVDLTQFPEATAAEKRASGVYSGSAILVDHAAGLLEAKIEAYQAATDEERTPAQKTNDAKLAEVLRHLKDLPPALSQSLDGLHEAFLQRHQTLQLPIDDPIGFSDLANFTRNVRQATAGRHGNGPLRECDFLPIRSGTADLRQLRLVDTFGRVKDLHLPDEPREIVRAETLKSEYRPGAISLSPRIVQPARLDFRWLSAQESGPFDTVQSNSHPASSPICGWILPNMLGERLSVYSAQGKALGIIARLEDHVVWQPSPGDPDPITNIDRPNPRINDHLAHFLRTIITDLGQKDTEFYSAFVSALGTALEAIAPEDFSTHRSLALLVGRPIAVVRAMVNLELKGRPATNDSFTSVLADLARSDEPAHSTKLPRQTYSRFDLHRDERDVARAALQQGHLQPIREIFGRRSIPFPAHDHDVALQALAGSTNSWRMSFDDQSYFCEANDSGFSFVEEGSRSSDDFCRVKFPIRIGEAQQLNDGLIGYFVETQNGGKKDYADSVFYAPQSATRVERDALEIADLSAVADALDLLQMPAVLQEHLNVSDVITITVNKVSHHWRLDTYSRVFEVTRGRASLEIVELVETNTRHIRTHWKQPVNLEQSIDDAPQKLTMLVDPQCAVHAVSGILPTKAITLPREYFSDALRDIEVTFLVAPILTGYEQTHLPLRAQEGFSWSWLSKNGASWSADENISSSKGQDGFPRRQRLIDGWLKLSRDAE